MCFWTPLIIIWEKVFFLYLGVCLFVCLFWGFLLVCIHPWSDQSQSQSCWQSPASLRSPWRAPWMRIGSQWPSRPPGCYPGMSITPVSSEIRRKLLLGFLHNLIEKIEYTCFNTSQHLYFFILPMKILLYDVLHQNDLTFCHYEFSVIIRNIDFFLDNLNSNIC